MLHSPVSVVMNEPLSIKLYSGSFFQDNLRCPSLRCNTLRKEECKQIVSEDALKQACITDFPTSLF